MERRTIASSLILILGTLSVYGQGYQRPYDNARTLLKAKKFDEALQEANRAIQLDRSQWAAYFVAGIALVGLKRRADAISYFQAALTRAPEPAKPTVNEAIAACHEILANRSQPPLASYSPPQKLASGWRVSMVAKYDIFKKTNNSVVWVEAVEDIVTAKKRLVSLASDGTDGYRIWDSAQEQFIDVLDDCA